MIREKYPNYYGSLYLKKVFKHAEVLDNKKNIISNYTSTDCLEVVLGH